MQKKILFIDDEIDIREAVRIILEEEDYKVKTAEDITSAKEVIAFMPDLIIVDVLLAKKTAHDIAKLLKENSTTKNIPIAILSAQSMAKLPETAEKCGASAYLQKPFEMKELVMLVENTI
jgi:DNA-binding response OmpR family regulator